MDTISIILAALLVLFVVLFILARRERDKYLLKFRPVQEERNQLKKEKEALEKQLRELPAGDRVDDNREKSKKKDKEKDKNESAKTIKSLKEDNFRLKQELRQARQEIKTISESGTEDQVAVVRAREEAEEAQRELKAALSKIKELEDRSEVVREPKAETIDVEAAVREAETRREAEARGKESERELEKVRIALQKSRDEFNALKNNFKEEVASAREEAKESVKSAKQETAKIKNQNVQLKKRADNSHKIFLIARSRLMLAEQRIVALDPNYVPSTQLPTGTQQVEDYVNKFLTRDARDEILLRDAEKNEQRVRELEAEIRRKDETIAELRSQAVSTASKNELVKVEEKSKELVKVEKKSKELVKVEEKSKELVKVEEKSKELVKAEENKDTVKAEENKDTVKAEENKDTVKAEENKDTVKAEEKKKFDFASSLGSLNLPETSTDALLSGIKLEPGSSATTASPLSDVDSGWDLDSF